MIEYLEKNIKSIVECKCASSYNKFDLVSSNSTYYEFLLESNLCCLKPLPSVFIPSESKSEDYRNVAYYFPNNTGFQTNELAGFCYRIYSNKSNSTIRYCPGGNLKCGDSNYSVAVCHDSEYNSTSFGKLTEVSLKIENDSIALFYKDLNITSKIYCNCMQYMYSKDDFQLISQSDSIYVFQLNSTKCCAKKQSTGGNNNNYSTGSSALSITGIVIGCIFGGIILIFGGKKYKYVWVKVRVKI